MLDIGIFGATGRVGRLLVNEILSHKRCRLASVLSLIHISEPTRPHD